MATNAYFLNQYISTTLASVGGIDASATTGIILASITNIDTTKPGIACLSYTNPLSTATAEWITYTSIDSGTKELQGVTRGQEGYAAKAHSNGVTVAFPLSESHINNLNTALMIGGSATNLTEGVLDEDDMSSNSATKLPTQQSVKAYSDSATQTLTNKTLTSPLFQGSVDGWIKELETFTYGSTTTIVVAGVDVSARYPKGTKIKLTQATGGTKYLEVNSATFSTNTTITFYLNANYTLANEEITNPFYSYSQKPVGFLGGLALSQIDRQGNNSTDWSSSGTTNYTSKEFSVQVGKIDVTGSSTATVTFPRAFTDKPVVFLTPFSASSATVMTVSNSGLSTTQFTIRNNDASARGVFWIAIGPMRN